jgi:hypothetical protein
MPFDCGLLTGSVRGISPISRAKRLVSPGVWNRRWH